MSLEEALKINGQGEELFNVGSVNEALSQFKRALELDPKCTVAINNLGVCFWQIGERAKAVETFERAIEVAPDNRDFIINYASIVDTAKHINGAKTAIESYVAKNPLDKEVRDALNVVNAQYIRLTLANPTKPS